MPLLFYGLILQANSKKEINHKNNGIHICFIFAGAPWPEHIPRFPLIYMDYERMGSGVFVYKYWRTGLWPGRIHHRKPGDRPLRRHAVRHFQIHRTCRRNKKERFLWWIRWQKDSNLPNCRQSRLLSHVKVNYRWWKKSQNRFVRSASPAGQAPNGFPLSFALNILKLIRFPAFPFYFHFFVHFPRSYDNQWIRTRQNGTFFQQPCFFLTFHEITIKRQGPQFLPLDGYLCFYFVFIFIAAVISEGNGMTIAWNPVRLLHTSDAYSWASAR